MRVRSLPVLAVAVAALALPAAARVQAAGGKIWSPDFQTLTAAKIAAARKWNLWITVWTVNEPADIARMIAAGVDGMASDYPDRVLEALKNR